MNLLTKFSASLLLLLPVCSCNCDHEKEPKEPARVGQILCTDGEIISLCDYVKSFKEAIGIVFYLSDSPGMNRGYAVYLRDLPPLAFADSVGIEQNTSKDILAWDGNQNTYSLLSNKEVHSPMAQQVFDMWKYGQSAYVPSVAEYRLLLDNKDFISERLVAIGGDPLPDDPDNCWLWTSTEVEGQDKHKAWLFSMHSGSIQETPKEQPHKVRPIITINY